MDNIKNELLCLFDEFARVRYDWRSAEAIKRQASELLDALAFDGQTQCI